MGKQSEVFIVTLDGLLTWHTILHGVDKTLRGTSGRWLRNGVIKEVELTDNEGLGDEIKFTVCFSEIQPDEYAELRVKQEAAIQAQLDKARRGEISYTEAFNLAAKLVDNGDFQVFHIETNHILQFYLGRLPGVGEKITKVELTSDNLGLGFTMVKV